MPRYYRQKTARSVETLIRAVLAILLLIAIGIGGVRGFAGVLAGLVVILVSLAIAGGLIFFIFKSPLVTTKKIGFSLIIVALLVGLSWNATKVPDMWPSRQATVIGPMGTGYTRVVKINVGGVLSPKFIDVRGPDIDKLKSGQKLTVWVNPDTGDEYSFEPRKNDAVQSYTFLYIAAYMATGGLVMLFAERTWITPSSYPITPPGPVPTNQLEVESRERSSTNLDVSAPSDTVKTPVRLSVSDRLAAIDWFQFEKVVKRVLEADGWHVEHKGGAHADGGVDLVASKDGRTAVVQCKYWHAFQVNVKVVRELLGAKNSAEFKADEAMLFTSNDCTKPTIDFAASNGITVRGADYIRTHVVGIGVECFPELMHPEIKFCPKCGAPMIWRANTARPFWGCSNYPRTHCHGKIEER